MRKDSPGVYLPPPLFYVAFFFLSIGLQRLVPLPDHLAHPVVHHILGLVCLAVAVVFVLPALLAFFRSRNTLITFLPAKSLQTGGIFSWSRNPMYFGLLMAYAGLACFLGNWWTLFLIPLLVLVVQRMVIIPEEEYLHRAFGADYTAYKARVSRWIGRRAVDTGDHRDWAKAKR
ncbi:MAG: isoprenylcysteine carboxylmethyltransferase family protein [Flavobacteriales bacterium]|nr:isoprenylcysteine carboxylmethyltransferase family protein [Flavobacteriales bacterium]